MNEHKQLFSNQDEINENVYKKENFNNGILKLKSMKPDLEKRETLYFTIFYSFTKLNKFY